MKSSTYILITGGAGFIGSHVNHQLRQKGYRTVVLDNLITGHRAAVQDTPFIEGSIADEHLLDKIFLRYNVSTVMHFAASIDVGESSQNPLKYYLNNVLGSIALFKAMHKHRVDKCIFSSSAAVYGIPEVVPIPESASCHPINPYGSTKRIIEQALQDLDVAHQMKFCSLRYFNAAGGDPTGVIKYFPRKESNLIPKILEFAQTGQGELTIYGTDYQTFDGTCIRDYVHVWDLASAHICAMESLLEGGDSAFYNLGHGEGYSVRQVIHAAEQVLQRRLLVKEGARRVGDPPILVADAKKAQVQLGWRPQHSSLESIIRDAWLARCG